MLLDAVIAKKLGVRRESICRWRRRNPALCRWLATTIGGAALEARPFVDRRVTYLALQGSVEHTKLFYQYVAKPGEGDSASVKPFQINVLAPAPEPLPVPSATPALPPAIQGSLDARPERPALAAAAKPALRPMRLPVEIPTLRLNDYK